MSFLGLCSVPVNFPLLTKLNKAETKENTTAKQTSRGKETRCKCYIGKFEFSLSKVKQS